MQPVTHAVHDNILIAFCTVCEARTLFHERLKNMYFVSIKYCEETVLFPSRVDQISRFVSSLNRELRSNPSKTIVVCEIA